METTPAHQPLDDIPLFRELTAGERARLADRFGHVRYALRQTVCRAGDPAGDFFVVHQGRARIVGRDAGGAEVTVGVLERGDHWGGNQILADEPHPFTVRATGDLILGRLAGTELRRLADAHPNLQARLADHPPRQPAPHDGRQAAHAPVNGHDAPPPPRDPQPAGPDAAPAEADDRPAFRPRKRRFPALLQVSETDCGAACLAIILRTYGKHVSINRLRDLANVTRDGASLYSLARAAETLGFHARGVRGSDDQLAHVELPAIAHWERFHYIVLHAVRRDHVIVADPAIGLRRLSRDAFAKGWTGYLLLLTPTPKLDEVAESKTTLGRYGALLRPHRRVAADILLASLLIQLFGLASPVFTQVIVDRVLVHQSVSTLNLLLGALFLVALFQTGTVALRYYLVLHTARRIQLQMTVAFYQHTLSLPLRFFEERRIGDMLKRFHENARFRDLLTGRALNVILDVVTIAAYGGLMLFYSAELSLVAAALLPAYALVAYVLTPVLRRQQREMYEKAAEAESQLVESVMGVATVKATAAEQGLRWRWQNLMVKALNLQMGNAQTHLAGLAVVNLLQTLGTLVLVWYGAHLVLDNQLSVGQLVAFNVLAVTATRPVLNLMDAWNQFQEFAVGLERLNDVFDAAPEEDPARSSLRPLPPVQGHIRFENVTFRYPARDKNVLQNITLDIRPGQTVALVGRSGAGKTTFASLLLRLHEPTSGRITIDGHDLRDVTLHSLRSQIGVVLQDNFLFSGTIRQNIALGEDDAPLDTVVGAAMLAGAHDFVRELPLAYETKVGEYGQSLSGGQKQRVAIARALFKNPRILVLDEATSALDTESERAIQRHFETVLRDRTTLVIAHRLSTVRDADLIVVLDQGNIVETGTHQTLMAQRGLYFYLHSQQLES